MLSIIFAGCVVPYFANSSHTILMKSPTSTIAKVTCDTGHVLDLPDQIYATITLTCKWNVSALNYTWHGTIGDWSVYIFSTSILYEGHGGIYQWTPQCVRKYI